MKRVTLMLLFIIAMSAIVFGQTHDKFNEQAAQELKQFESAWTTASLNRDQIWLERFFTGKLFVAPFAITDETIKNRSTEIAAMVERAVPTNILSPRDVKVRITGNVFVLGANASENGGSNPSYYFLDTFNKHNGKWEVVATHFSSVSETTSIEADEQAIMQIEREWNDALVKDDTAKLDRIFADDYVLTNSLGEVKTKAIWMKGVGTDNATNEAGVLDDVKIRVYGDTAILTGRVTRKEQAENQENSSQYRTTHVYEKRQGRWQVVANQMTAIAK